MGLTGKYLGSLAAPALYPGHNGSYRRAESISMTTTPAASWACGNAAPRRREIRRAAVSLADDRAVGHFANCHKWGDCMSPAIVNVEDPEWR